MFLICVFCATAAVRSPAQSANSSLSRNESALSLASAQVSSASELCNSGQSICVPQAARNMLLTNPFDIAVTAAGSVSDVAWELDDQSGQKLVSGQATSDPNWPSGSNPATPESFHMKEFIFALPKSATGSFKLSPVRNDKQGEPTALPALVVPVQFGSATTTLALVVPKNFSQYLNEESDWANTHDPSSHFTPASPFMTQRLTVLRVTDAIFASAEAAAENPFLPTQAPIRIFNFAIQNGTAYVDLNLNEEGYGWAGVSNTIARVEPLIEKDLLQFPGIHAVAFSWPPPRN
jgi:hypothetical protein